MVYRKHKSSKYFWKKNQIISVKLRSFTVGTQIFFLFHMSIWSRMTDTNFKQRFQRRITLKLSSNICMFLANTALTWQHQWPGLVLVSASFPCLPMWFSYVELDPPTLQLNSIFPSISYSRPYKLYNKRLLPPANEVWGQGDVLHLSVILFTGEGVICLPHCMLGYTPLWADTPPLGRHPPLGYYGIRSTSRRYTLSSVFPSLRNMPMRIENCVCNGKVCAKVLRKGTKKPTYP